MTKMKNQLLLYFILLLLLCPYSITQNIFPDHYETDDIPLLKEQTNPNFVYAAAFFAAAPFPAKIYNEQLGLYYSPELVSLYSYKCD